MKRRPVFTPPGLTRRAMLGRVAAVGAALGLGGRAGPAAGIEADPAGIRTFPTSFG